jgi:hypothetical protein
MPDLVRRSAAGASAPARQLQEAAQAGSARRFPDAGLSACLFFWLNPVPNGPVHILSALVFVD